MDEQINQLNDASSVNDQENLDTRASENPTPPKRKLKSRHRGWVGFDELSDGWVGCKHCPKKMKRKDEKSMLDHLLLKCTNFSKENAAAWRELMIHRELPISPGANSSSEPSLPNRGRSGEQAELRGCRRELT